MADISHTPPTVAPVEGDGISYSGIVWFVVILTATTLICQVLMWVLLRTMQHQNPAPEAERQALDGRVHPDMVHVGPTNGPTPQLLVREPINLDTFREQEEVILNSYGLMDQNAGTYRIPIDRAKELVLERNLLAVRGKAPDAKPDAKTGVKKTEAKETEVKK
jgi:hypothetical protein